MKTHGHGIPEKQTTVKWKAFRQKDAVCLQDRAKRMEIAVQFPHDGLLFDDRIYFGSAQESDEGRILSLSGFPECA